MPRSLIDLLWRDHPDAPSGGSRGPRAQASQPSWFFMDGYKKELRRDVRKVLRPLELDDANGVRDEIENYAIHAYAGSH